MFYVLRAFIPFDSQNDYKLATPFIFEIVSAGIILIFNNYFLKIKL